MDWGRVVDDKDISRATMREPALTIIREVELLRGDTPRDGASQHRRPTSRMAAGPQRPSVLRALDRLPARSTSLLYLSDALILLGYVTLGAEYWRVLTALWFLTVIVFRTRGLYQPRLTLSVLDDLPAILSGLLTADLVVAVVTTRIHGYGSLKLLGALMAVGGLGHIVTRALAYFLIRRARLSTRLGYRTIVVGSGEVSRTLARILDERPSLGLKVMGYVDDHASPSAGSAGWRYLGSVDVLPALMETFDVRVLVLGFGRIRDLSITELVRQHRLKQADLFVVPRMFEVSRLGRTADHIGGIPVARLSTRPVRGIRFLPKRIFDVAVAAIAVIALSPLLLLLWGLVRMDGGRGVLFRQKRVGRDGRAFEVWKFRSMAPERSSVADTQWSDAAQSRVTRLGRFLRATSLDELPQLFNVLRGDMSLVGPRPERPHFVVQFSSSWPHYHHRHRMPVGITGLAQSQGLRGDTSIEDRARLDNYYIENWSLWLDVKVLLRTVVQVLGARGR
jgi:exopolysaccharide biosynthesis polyprenyl glycosylphosphotransferase